jgi:hypothetical protein
MSLVEWILQAGLVLAIVAALPVAIRLERAMTALRRDRQALANSMRGFADATKEAEVAIARLRAVAESAGREIASQTAQAATLREDLRFLSERAEGVADRLDGAVRTARLAPGFPGNGPAPAAASPGAGREPPRHAVPGVPAEDELAALVRAAAQAGAPAAPRPRAELELRRALGRVGVS